MIPKKKVRITVKQAAVASEMNETESKAADESETL